MFTSKPRSTIALQPYQGIFHLHPPDEYEHLELDSDEDETFWGNVVLSLVKPRDITKLVVRLNAHYTLALPGQPTETGILDTWDTNVPVPLRLQTGEHTFAWALKVPRSSAPYERCAFGRVYYVLSAVAESPDGRQLKNDFYLEVVVSPNKDGDTAVLNERIEGFDDHVGPYLMTLASQHLTVGGAMHFSLNLASVPGPLRVHEITAQVMQSYTLLSHAKPGRFGEPAPHRRLVFHIDHRTPIRVEGAPLVQNTRRPATVLKTSSSLRPQTGEALMAVLNVADSLRISHVARLPDDDLLRPSTHPGTRAPIRVAHRIVIDVKFSTPGQPAQLLRAERPLTVLSCGCLPEDLTVPPYEQNAATSKHTKKKRDTQGRDCGDYYTCVCLYTLDTLLQAHDAPLLSAHEALARPDLLPEEVFLANKRGGPPCSPYP